MQRLIECAKKEVGYKEDDYGESKYFIELFPNKKSMPWCLPFIEWIFDKAYGTEKAQELLCLPNSEYIYSVPAMINIAKRNNRFHYHTYKVGWLIFIRTDNAWTNHIELIIDEQEEKLISIGGNCGGEVRINEYDKNDFRISGYMEIKYPCSDKYEVASENINI